MPSSPMSTLPRPSTSVFSCFVSVELFVTLLSFKLPPAYDRGYSAATLDVIVVKGKINMNDDKRHKEPQEQVVPEPHSKFAAHRSKERRVGKECRSRWSPY